MRIRYEIKFDEPLKIDGDWPLNLPNGGTFQVIRENGKAVGFTVEFTGTAPDIFRVKDGINKGGIYRWSEMMMFYGRLRSYLQCVSEIDFDPSEVSIDHIGETEEEKKQYPMCKMVMPTRKDRTAKNIIDPEILAATVFASCNDDTQAPHFIGELKRMSRRSKREGRYVDSFRYDFLIMETLYGKGQFKTKQLADAMKSEKNFLDILQIAKKQTSITSETPRDETETLICSSCSSEDLVDHIIKMRGYYFHGRKRMIARRDWRLDDKARTLCIFSNSTTDMVLQELTSHIYEDGSGKQYEECAKTQGMVTILELDVLLWLALEKRSRQDKIHEEVIGDVSSSRNRIKWAMSILERLKYNEDQPKLESLVGKDQESGQELFMIRISRAEILNLNESDTCMDDSAGLDETYILTYKYSEEEEELVTDYRSQKGTSPRG